MDEKKLEGVIEVEGYFFNDASFQSAFTSLSQRNDVRGSNSIVGLANIGNTQNLLQVTGNVANVGTAQSNRQ